jgi:hypothetical protein
MKEKNVKLGVNASESVCLSASLSLSLSPRKKQNQTKLLQYWNLDMAK